MTCREIVELLMEMPPDWNGNRHREGTTLHKPSEGLRQDQGNGLEEGRLCLRYSRHPDSTRTRCRRYQGIRAMMIKSFEICWGGEESGPSSNTENSSHVIRLPVPEWTRSYTTRWTTWQRQVTPSYGKIRRLCEKQERHHQSREIIGKCTIYNIERAIRSLLLKIALENLQSKLVLSLTGVQYYKLTYDHGNDEITDQWRQRTKVEWHKQTRTHSGFVNTTQQIITTRWCSHRLSQDLHYGFMCFCWLFISLLFIFYRLSSPSF